jgi:hypothetical protein
LNRLFGQIDDVASRDGDRSLLIELSPQNQPVSYFDYYELSRMPVRAPLAASIGYIEVEPGREYTFSAYTTGIALAGGRTVSARLAIRQFEGGTFEKFFKLSGQWERVWLSFKPTSRWCYVLAGPDLRETKENTSPPSHVKLWMDSLQLEQADKPTEFEPRDLVEFGLSTGRTGNVLGWDDLLEIRVEVAKRDAKP